LVNLVKWAKITIFEPSWLKFGMDVLVAPNLKKRWVKAFPTIESGRLGGQLANWAKIVISERILLRSGMDIPHSFLSYFLYFFLSLFLARLVAWLFACLQREKCANISIYKTI
jgi:hypothetical protein